MQSFHYYSIFNIWKCYFTRGIVVTVSWNDWGCQGLLSPLGLTSPPAGTPKAGCPDSFWRPPRRRPHNVWAICSSAQVRSTAWCSEGTSCIPVCAHCLFGLGHYQQKPGSILFESSLGVFTDINKILLNLPHPETSPD